MSHAPSSSPSPFRHILFELGDGVARLVLHRPDKLNALTADMLGEIRAALESLQRTPSARVLLLTGSGRGFCAGQDLSEDGVAPAQTTPASQRPTPDLGETVEKFYAPLVLALRRLPMPVVCAVNGVAAGAGANLALACDIVIAARSAFFVQPFCRLGLVPDTGGTYFLPRMVCTARATAWAMLGDKLSAETASAWGLIWKCVDDAELPAQAEHLLTHFATAPTLGLARIKEALQRSPHHTLEQQLALERDFMRDLGRSHDYQEGVAAFLEKRAPKFKGA
jgi:2-(1,2-epoxy-1,2-dihydrophenyl)acetyl-CoA isomerase